MIIYIIYTLIVLILIFISILAIKAIGRGIKVKNKNKKLNDDLNNKKK